MIHLLPGIRESRRVVSAQQRKVRTAMTGMASQTGRFGEATSPPMIHPEMGTRNSRCIRYMPKEHFDRVVTSRGAVSLRMQEKARKMPAVASTTLGVQNS